MRREEVRVRVGGRLLTVSNLTKVLYPETGTMKGDVLSYYQRIAPLILPHLRDRPITLKRYPDGVEGLAFFEKRCPHFRPEWVETAPAPSEREGSIDFCLINDEAALIWVANLAALELHPLLSRREDTGRPTMLVFDLDPGPPATLLECCRVALELRDLLAEFGLASYPKTSGGKGLHFYVPLNTPVTFAQTKSFARTVAELFMRHYPDQATSIMAKDRRRGKVFIDWSQNDEHKTTICAYSLRARPRPTVSTPVHWDEIADALRAGDTASLIFEYDAVLRRIERLGDLLRFASPSRSLVLHHYTDGLSVA